MCVHVCVYIYIIMLYAIYHITIHYIILYHVMLYYVTLQRLVDVRSICFRCRRAIRPMSTRRLRGKSFILKGTLFF